MKYFIGIDGGGTKTNIVLTDKDLEIYDQDSAGPANYLSEGKEKAAFVITELIWEVMRNSDVRSSDITAIGACVSGIGREEDRIDLKIELENQLKKKGVFINKLIVDTDAKAALIGAHSGKSGCMLIAGTGSIIYGKLENGTFFRCGGFGRIIGDEGSGYSIGRRAFQLLGKVLDERENDSLLSKQLREVYKIETEDDLIDNIYKSKIEVASAAEIVIKTAQNDVKAKEILNSESDELLRLVSVASLKYGKNDFMISLSGGLLQSENLYSSMVTENIKKNFPGIKIKQPDHPPAIGAILLADMSR